VSLRRALLLAGTILLGSFATPFVYAAHFVVQTVNADDACESYPQNVPGAGFSDVRGVGFENSFLNLGGHCTFHMNDGSVVITREPGWWFSGTIAGFAAVFAGLVGYLARRKEYSGWVAGLYALLAPPLALLLTVIAVPKAGRVSAMAPEEG
jgi:hypothetical protein